jgi:hypothetical protein
VRFAVGRASARRSAFFQLAILGLLELLDQARSLLVPKCRLGSSSFGGSGKLGLTNSILDTMSRIGGTGLTGIAKYTDTHVVAGGFGSDAFER